MKHLKRISLMVMVMLVCAALFVLSPLSVSAAELIEETKKETYENIYGSTDKGDYYQIADIHSDGVTITTDDANLEGQTYSFNVATTGEAYSSFRLTILMPSFVNVIEVVQSDSLLNISENGVFESNISNNTVSVSFSSPVNFSDLVLFSINFTVNDYSEQSQTVNCYDCQLVNEDIEIVGAAFNLGSISITQNIMMGDVNADLTVNLADLLIIQRSIVNENFPLTDTQTRAADIDKNGVVDMLDCQYIQNFLVGRIGSLDDVANGDITEPEDPNTEIRYIFETALEGMYVRYEFYTDGTLLAKITNVQTGQVNVNAAEWDYDGEYVNLIYEGEAVQQFTVNEDDYTLTLIDTSTDGCSHRSTVTGGREATCTERGYLETICNECKEVLHKEVIPALGHDYGDDDVCDRCGDGEIKEDKKIVYTYASEELILYLYSDYTAYFAELGFDTNMDGELDSINGEGSWYMANGRIYVNTDFNVYAFTATASGELIPYEEGGDIVEPDVCKHEECHTIITDATCTEGSYYKAICISCKEVLENKIISEALGHDYGDDDICDKCGEGETDADLESMIAEAVTLANEEWNSLLDKGASMATIMSHENYYLLIVDRMSKADSVESLEMCKEEFNALIDVIMKDIGGDVTDPEEPNTEIRYMFDSVIEGMKIVYEFYTNGELHVQLTNLNTGEMSEDYADWTFNGEYVEVIYDGEVVQQFTVNEDDYTLTPVDSSTDGCSHRSTVTGGREATCTERGYLETICNECKEVLHKEVIPALGHDYGDDDVCDRCGDGDVTEKKEVLYTYSSKELTLILYSDNTAHYTELIYTADGMVNKSEGEGEWYLLAEIGRIYTYVNDTEYVFTANERGELIPYEEGGDIVEPEVCKHEEHNTIITDATCTEGSYYKAICASCKEVLENKIITEALGHDYDESGVCARCGDGDITEKKEVLYTYSSKELTLILYSDNTAHYTELIYTADGMVNKSEGEGEWYLLAEDGRIYVYVNDTEYAFTATESGELTLS